MARVGTLLCVGGAALGVLGLVGSLTGTLLLTTVVPGQPPMMPLTGFALALLGFAGALHSRAAAPPSVRRTLCRLAGIVVLVLGVATIADYAVDIYFDRLLLFREHTHYLRRPSPLTATALTLLAAALLFIDHRPTARARPSEWLILGACVAALTALIGQVFGAGPLYRLRHSPVIGVALPTALSLLLTGVGLPFGRPDAGIMRIVTSAGPGGVILRRLVPAMVVAPAVLVRVITWLFGAMGADDLALMAASIAAAMSIGGVLLLVVIAAPLNRSHEALESSRARTRELFEQAPDGIIVADANGEHLDVNSAGCRMLGYDREEIVGKKIVDLLPPEEAARFSQSKQQLSEGGIQISEWTFLRKNGTPLPVEVSARSLPDGRWQGFVRDISDRKGAQQELRESRERFELALRGADLVAWDWNIQTGEVVFDRRWAELRGLRPEEVRPHVESWISKVHPDDLPRVQKALSDYFQGLTPEYESEHRVLAASGGWMWILDRGKVFAHDEQGRPVRMVGTELDITHRKRLEEELRLSEAKSSGIVSVSPDAIISIDESHRITMFNEGAEKIFGYSKLEAIGAPLEMLIPERIRKLHGKHIETFAAGQEIARRMGERGQILGMRKTGEEFPADVSISKLDVGGKRVLTVSLRDMTEQVRRENEQKFLAELGSVLASTLDYEDTLANIARLAIRELADVCIVELVEEDGSLRPLKVVSRDPAKAWLCEMLMKLRLDRKLPHLVRSAMETKRPVLIERLTPDMIASLSQSEDHLRALRGTDSCSVIGVPLVARDKLLGAIAFVSANSSRMYGPADVTFADALARHAALSIDNARLYGAAQRAIQAREEMLGIVAHDLRSPLGTMRMQAELLRCGEVTPERLGRAADVIERAATRMDRLVQDLLDVTRMEAGHLGIEQVRMPVCQVVRDSVEAQVSLAASFGVELRVDAAQDLPDVWADPDRLLQVFENLIGNALKFTKPGGRITIGAAPREGDVLFWVADTGIGVPTENLPRLFDRFWQAQKDGRRGAGLGLPIVKGIVEAHGGRVCVDSALGRGTSFFFTIPTAPPAQESRLEPAARRPDEGDARAHPM